MLSIHRLVPLLLVVSLASPAQGQTFTEKVDVSLINVDAVVTDRGGKPVSGLTVEDFEVFDNGVSVPITNFTALPGGRRATLGGAPAGAEAGEPLQLIVVLDNVNTRPQNRAHLLSQLGTLLAARIGPRDRVMLASYDKVINIHAPLTNRPELIQAGLDKLAATPSFGLEMDADFDMAVETIEQALEGEDRLGCAHLLEGVISRFTNSVSHRVGATIDALVQLVGSLGGVPGRKTLLYLSDGLELRPGSYVALSLAEFCGDSAASLRAEGYDTALAMRRLTSVANAARVSFYPIDAAGGRQAPRGGRRGGYVQHEQRSSLTDSLSFLALDTGGRALLNAIDLPAALEPMWEDLGASYSLAYEAPKAPPGTLHSIEVRVKRRGLTARYRHSYAERNEEERLTDLLLAALWQREAANGLDLRSEPAGAAVATESGTFLVPLRIGIPLAKIRLVEGQSGHVGKLTVFVLALDEQGHSTPLASAKVPVKVLASELGTANEQLFGYEIKLEMPKGKERVAFAVRDELTGELAILTHEIEVGL